MNLSIDDYRQSVADCYNLPLDLLPRNSKEAIDRQAEALRDYRDSVQDAQNKELLTSEQFSMWFNGQLGISAPSAEHETVPNYPSVKDSGEVHGIYSPSPLEEFRDWFYNKSAYNPKKSDGWTCLN